MTPQYTRKHPMQESQKVGPSPAGDFCLDCLTCQVVPFAGYPFILNIYLIGLAYVGGSCNSNPNVQWCGLCNSGSQQSIVELQPLKATTATIAAHEIGHK